MFLIANCYDKYKKTVRAYPLNTFSLSVNFCDENGNIFDVETCTRILNVLKISELNRKIENNEKQTLG